MIMNMKRGMIIIMERMRNRLSLVSVLGVLSIWVGNIYVGEFVFIGFVALNMINSNEI